MNDLDTQPGIGRTLAAELRSVGIRDMAALREVGAAEAAARLAEVGLRDEMRVQLALTATLAEPPAPRAAAPPEVQEVGSVLLTVGDLDAALEHYAGGMGLPLAVRHDDPRSAALRLGHAGVTLLVREDRAVPVSAPSPGSPRVWLVVPDAAAAAKHLLAAGLAPLPAGPDGEQVVEIADRWGNVLGFVDRR